MCRKASGFESRLPHSPKQSSRRCSHRCVNRSPWNFPRVDCVMTNHQPVAEEYRGALESFRDSFNEYAKEVFGNHRRVRLDELRPKLQRLEPRITAILLEVLGEGSFGLGHSGTVSRRDLLPSALMGGNNEARPNFREFSAAVTSSLERTLGTLEAGLWPPNEPTPLLVIKDTELRDRCTDLLAAPGNYDRVIREATVVLEDHIRHKVDSLVTRPV